MSESLQESQHGKIGRNVSYLTISTVVTMALSLVLRFLMPRALGPEQMGIFYFAESFATLFFSFLPLGFQVYISRTVPADNEHPKEILPTILVTGFFTALVIGVIALVTIFSSERSDTAVYCLVLMCFYSAMYIFQRAVFQPIFMAINKVKLIVTVSVIVKVIAVCGAILVLYLSKSIAGVAAVFFASEIVGLFVFMFVSYRAGFLRNPPSLVTLKKILKVSLPFYLSGTLIALYGEVDTFMLGSLATPEEVGFYGAAFKVIGVALLLSPILINASTPVLSRALAQDRQEFLDLIRNLFQIILVCSLPLCATLILFGDLIVGVLYGGGFSTSVKTLAFLTPALIFLYINTLVSTGLSLGGSGIKLSRVFVFGLIINLGLDYFLIPQGIAYGPGGAGLAVCVCAFLSEAYTFVAMQKIFPMKLLNRRLIKNMFLVFLPCFVGMIFFEDISALSFFERTILAALVPVYALVFDLVSWVEIKWFSEIVFGFLSKKFLDKKRSV